MFFFLKSVFTLLFFVLLSLVVLAGDEQWRPVSPAELSLKESSIEKDADAEAIFWEVRLDDKKSSQLAYEHYVRVKIFTERGRERFSKFDIPFLKGKKVRDVAARVVKPDGTIIELNPQDVFEREIVKGDGFKVKAVSFAISGIEPGVILEYRYREIFKNDSASGERLLFQRDIPIQRMSYYVRPYEDQILRVERFNMPADVGFSKDVDGFSVATMRNIPAFKEEPQMPPPDQVRSWALIYYSGLFSQNWSSMAIRFGMSLDEIIKPNNEVKKAAAEITVGAATDEEKLKKIYQFVQTQIRNVTFDKTMTDEQKESVKNKTPGDTLKRRMGTAPDIEILFASLVTATGMEARIVMSGDRSEFFFQPNKNAHASFVHLACIAVKDGEKWRYFNPGTPYLAFGQLAWYEEGVATILIGAGGYLLGHTPVSDVDKNTIKRTGKFKLLEDGTLEGNIKIEYTGQGAILRRASALNDSEQQRQEDFKTGLKDKINAAEIADVSIRNFTDNSQPLVFTAKIRIPNYAQKTGKRLFFQPGFFEYGSTPLFSSAERKYSVYFRHPWAENDEIEIELPEGFSLDKLDTPDAVADNSQVGRSDIRFSFTLDKKKLFYTRSFHFGKGGKIIFPVSAYPNLKALFEAFHKADTHNIVLKQESVATK